MIPGAHLTRLGNKRMKAVERGARTKVNLENKTQSFLLKAPERKRERRERVLPLCARSPLQTSSSHSFPTLSLSLSSLSLSLSLSLFFVFTVQFIFVWGQMFENVLTKRAFLNHFKSTNASRFLVLGLE